MNLASFTLDSVRAANRGGLDVNSKSAPEMKARKDVDLPSIQLHTRVVALVAEWPKDIIIMNE
jgi:hypothetical protein